MQFDECYSYFSITSDDEFDPDDISRLLDIQAKDGWRKGEQWRIFVETGEILYRHFSSWTGCQQHQPMDNAHQQCLNIVRQLHPKIATLSHIKQQYHADFMLYIVPTIHSNSPVMFFDHDIIEFCYLTGTHIDVDIYLHQHEKI